MIITKLDAARRQLATAIRLWLKREMQSPFTPWHLPLRKQFTSSVSTETNTGAIHCSIATPDQRRASRGVQQAHQVACEFFKPATEAKSRRRRFFNSD
jgi:hypothetical protein